MNKLNLLGYSKSDMENLMLDLGRQKYKGRQLYKWLYQIGQTDFDQMTDLKSDLREKLKKKFLFEGLTLANLAISKDGTEKYVFELDDKSLIETVMIPEGDKRTICISSQTGCALACRFCATGTMGKGRNLSVGEIIGQLLFVRDRFPDNPYTSIVYMGMGEPLQNLANVFKSVDIIKSSIGLTFTAKKITISTVGLTSQIYRFSDSDYKLNLAISLHAPSQEKRLEIMPIAKSNPLDRLMKAAKYFTEKKGKRITFEYILFKGFNDSKDDAYELAKLIRGIPCKINLLAYNPVAGLPYGRPSEDEINEFGKILYPMAPVVTVRKSRGLDIAAACGQLAGKDINNE